MKLYFGNAVATTTTLMILALLGFIGWSVWGRAVIQYWGRRSVLLLVFGLVVCCFAVARDAGYIKRFRMPLTEAAHRDCFHWSAFPPSSAVSVRC